MTPDRQAVERAARAAARYALEAVGVRPNNADDFDEIVDNALRAALDAETTAPPATKPEEDPCGRCGKSVAGCDCEDPRLVGYENNPVPTPPATKPEGCPRCYGTGRVIATRTRVNAVTEQNESVAAGWTYCECVRQRSLADMARICDESAEWWKAKANDPALPHDVRMFAIARASGAMEVKAELPPPTPAEGRGEEARIDALAKVLADANADYVEPRVGEEGKRYGVDLPERFCEMYRYMAARAIRSLPHGDGGGRGL